MRVGLTQALNQLATPGGAKIFLRVAQIFGLCPILLNDVQHICRGGVKNLVACLGSPLTFVPGTNMTVDARVE